jgi:hypothetical protein
MREVHVLELAWHVVLGIEQSDVGYCCMYGVVHVTAIVSMILSHICGHVMAHFTQDVLLLQHAIHTYASESNAVHRERCADCSHVSTYAYSLNADSNTICIASFTLKVTVCCLFTL